jgi:hypothetical protein
MPAATRARAADPIFLSFLSDSDLRSVAIQIPTPSLPPHCYLLLPTSLSSLVLGRVRAHHRLHVPVASGGASHRRAPHGLPLRGLRCARALGTPRRTTCGLGTPRRVARDPRGGRPRRGARRGRLRLRLASPLRDQVRRVVPLPSPSLVRC